MVENSATMTPMQAIDFAASQINESTRMRKCFPCGCLHDTVGAITEAYSDSEIPPRLYQRIEKAKSLLVMREYDCLGCEICPPARAVNALNDFVDEAAIHLDPCKVEELTERAGWPILPGDFIVLRYRASVAVCTLTDELLREQLAKEEGSSISIVGSLHTENLGIERIVTNTSTNPHIRFLIVCGIDSKAVVGHLPGQSLISFTENGITDDGRIIGAEGKRPFLHNISPDAIRHFRDNIEIIDMRDCDEISDILKIADDLEERNPGESTPFDPEKTIEPIHGFVPKKMTPDPSGYFVIFVDRGREQITLEHYNHDGFLDGIIDGKTAAELYFPAIENNFISRLEHAAYLGHELAKAEHSLEFGDTFYQDAAPEQFSDTQPWGCDPGST